MSGEGISDSLTAAGILSLIKRRREIKLLWFAATHRSQEVRVSFCSLLRMRDHDSYLLIRNNLRPELFGPIGGVVKFYDPATAFLDSISFRPQNVSSDMDRDLRGFLPAKCLLRLVAWYRRGSDCETAEICADRELREELKEISLKSIRIPTSLAFRKVRQVIEGPSSVPGANHKQLRIFDVLELRPDTPGANAFVNGLWKLGSNHRDLRIVSSDEITKGRAQDGTYIGHLSEYLFRDHALRPDAPVFTEPREDRPI